MAPLRLAILNDYEIVVVGLASLLDPRDEIEIVDLSVSDDVSDPVDIVLYDTFGATDRIHGTIEQMLDDPHVGKVAVYTWNFDRDQIDRELERGVAGHLSKTLSADGLVDALQRIHAGEVVVSDAPSPRAPASEERKWPGQNRDLTEKEADVLALITRGLDNRAIAEHLYISPNTLKTRIRHLYRKIGVDSRVQAALWGVKHGFEPDNEIEWSAVRWTN